MKKSFFVGAILMALVGHGFAQTHSARISVQKRLSGAQCRALASAYLDFEKHIKPESAANEPFEKFVADIQNYSVTFTEDKKEFSVEFSPLPFEGGPVKGGGALYRITKASGVIRDREYYK